MRGRDGRRVLFLGPGESMAYRHLCAVGEEVDRLEVQLNRDLLDAGRYELLVSHGYRHILRPQLLRALDAPAVNLHISLLPWNRGAHPNVWSAFEGSPSGVTVHEIDAGVDTGRVIVQREVPIEADETLKSSYELLQAEVTELFARVWEDLRNGSYTSREQGGGGSYHRVSDLERIKYAMPYGWDTTVATVRSAGAKSRS